mgnify:CR=1 FL=1
MDMATRQTFLHQKVAQRSPSVVLAMGEKQAAILRSEGEKQAAILQAEGERESAFRDAEARERLAEAEAFATKEVSQAIAEGNIQAINYFIAQRYIDALGAYARSQGEKVLFLPLEATSIVDSVSGVAQLAASAREQRGGEG